MRIIQRFYTTLKNKTTYLFGSKRGSPLVEESILLGLSLFAFMILATIIFDLIEFAKNIFTSVSDGLEGFP